MIGILYGVGVGPGDPELLTLKAVRIIQECDCIAVPDSGSGEQVALDIAEAYVGDKPILRCPMPMTRDESALRHSRLLSARLLCEHLEQGKNIAFLTLGDPTVYSTYLYLHRLVIEWGYTAHMIAGVPSFCAAAAALDMPLCEAGQPLHILPASYEGTEEALLLDGVKVLMKSGKSIGRLLSLLEEKGLAAQAAMAERVGLPGERLTRNLANFQGDPGYFSIVVVKEARL